MGSKTASQQTQSQNQTTTPNPTALAAYNTALGMASTAASTPYQAYTGELTAGVNGQEQAGIAATNTLGSSTAGYLNAAGGLAGASTAAVNPTAVDASAINQYMSPYQSDVINATEAQLNQQDQQQAQAQTSNAIGAGAFGGDRAGVAQAALAGQQDLANNSTIAGLENQNYTQALGEANTQQATNLSAAQANRTALQTGASLDTSLGSTASSTGIADAGAQIQGGELQQSTQQAADTANYGQYQAAEAYPFQTTQFYSNIAEGVGSNMGSTSSGTGTTTTQTNPLNSILGLGLGAAAVAPSTTSLFSLSDRRLKEHIRPIGKTFDNQVIYSFNFKGDPHPEIGLIAQEVEKKHPHAVGTLGDAKIVNLAEATRKAADKGHFARGGRTLGDIGFHRLSPEDFETVPMARAAGGRVATLGDAPLFDDPRHHLGLGAGRAAGGSVGALPYTTLGTGYVPMTGTGGVSGSRMPTPTLNLSPPQQPQATQAGLANLKAGLGLAGGALQNRAANADADATQDLDYFARGGVVRGLGAARMRRGFDTGGVVGTDGLLFDPSAVDGDTSFAPGLGLAPATDQSMSPPSAPPPGLGGAAVAAPAPPPQALPPAAAPPVTSSAPSSNDNALPTFAQGLGGAGLVDPYASGLGSAALPPSSTPSPAPGLGSAALPPVAVGPTPGATNYSGGDGQGLGGAGVSPVTPGGVAGPSPTALPSNGVDAINAATAPRSVRNNNPGNVVDGPFAQSQPGYAGSDGRFAIFKTPDAGASAMDGLLTNYGSKGLNTPLSIVSRWAPAGDGANNPVKYASSVASQLGIGINDPIDMSNPTQRTALARAMSNVEAGTAPSATLGSALAYGGGDTSAYTSGLGGASLAGTQAASGGLGAANLNPTSRTGGLLGFGPGGDGGLLGLSDATRTGLLGMAAGMMSSTSMSPGLAIGQGGVQGLKSYETAVDQQRKAGLAGASMANTQSEIGNRAALQGIERARVGIAGGELGINAQRATQQGQNFASEAEYRKGQVANEQTRTALQRYEVIPNPDGNGFSYYDKANPAAGITSSDKGIPGVPGSAQPTAAPVKLDSTGFEQTGRPTMAAPHGYMPVNWAANQIRMKSSPAIADATAAQTRNDVTTSATAAQKANNALYYADEMDRNADTLAKGGLLTPGAAFPERLNLAKSYNLAANAIGLPTVDQDSVRAGEALTKDQTRLASQLTSTLGSREAASIFSSMMSATPGAQNTAAGYKAISSSIRVLAQRDVDRNAFVQDYASRYGETREAENVFDQLNPPMMYARQAQMLSKIDRPSVDLLQQNPNDPRYVAGFEQQYGKGTARYFTGGQ